LVNTGKGNASKRSSSMEIYSPQRSSLDPAISSYVGNINDAAVAEADGFQEPAKTANASDQSFGLDLLFEIDGHVRTNGFLLSKP
jgi:hypothetical protein